MSLLSVCSKLHWKRKKKIKAFKGTKILKKLNVLERNENRYERSFRVSSRLTWEIAVTEAASTFTLRGQLRPKDSGRVTWPGAAGPELTADSAPRLGAAPALPGVCRSPVAQLPGAPSVLVRVPCPLRWKPQLSSLCPCPPGLGASVPGLGGGGDNEDRLSLNLHVN